MHMVGFGLNSDEWNFMGLFFGGLVVALVPIYVTLLRARSDTKRVRHEVTHNGGVTGEAEPTVKDYAKGAYDEAVLARSVADRASITASTVNRRLSDHIIAAEAERAAITRRLDRIDDHLTASTSQIVVKVEEGRST